METMLATVDCDGQLVLPAEIQRMLGILPGCKVKIAVHRQQIEITPQDAAPIDAEVAHRAIQELWGVFAGQPSLEDEYFRDRERDKW